MAGFGDPARRARPGEHRRGLGEGRALRGLRISLRHSFMTATESRRLCIAFLRSLAPGPRCTSTPAGWSLRQEKHARRRVTGRGRGHRRRTAGADRAGPGHAAGDLGRGRRVRPVPGRTPDRPGGPRRGVERAPRGGRADPPARGGREHPGPGPSECRCRFSAEPATPVGSSVSSPNPAGAGPRPAHAAGRDAAVGALRGSRARARRHRRGRGPAPASRRDQDDVRRGPLRGHLLLHAALPGDRRRRARHAARRPGRLPRARPRRPHRGRAGLRPRQRGRRDHGRARRDRSGPGRGPEPDLGPSPHRALLDDRRGHHPGGSLPPGSRRCRSGSSSTTTATG
jgi:hypothetical protein